MVGAWQCSICSCSWKLLGMESGNSLIVNNTEETPELASGAPDLQYATQLIIKTNLGVAARSASPKGNMSIPRRVVVDIPTFALVVDRHSCQTSIEDVNASEGHRLAFIIEVLSKNIKS